MKVPSKRKQCKSLLIWSNLKPKNKILLIYDIENQLLSYFFNFQLFYKLIDLLKKKKIEFSKM